MQPPGQAGSTRRSPLTHMRGFGHAAPIWPLCAADHQAAAPEFDAGRRGTTEFLFGLRKDAKSIGRPRHHEAGDAFASSRSLSRGDTSSPAPRQNPDQTRARVLHLDQGGTRALRISTFPAPQLDAFACTLTSLIDLSRKWERNAALPGIGSRRLRKFSRRRDLHLGVLEPTTRCGKSSLRWSRRLMISSISSRSPHQLSADYRRHGWRDYTLRMPDQLARFGHGTKTFQKGIARVLPEGLPEPASRSRTLARDITDRIANCASPLAFALAIPPMAGHQ